MQKLSKNKPIFRLFIRGFLFMLFDGLQITAQNFAKWKILLIYIIKVRVITVAFMVVKLLQSFPYQISTHVKPIMGVFSDHFCPQILSNFGEIFRRRNIVHRKKILWTIIYKQFKFLRKLKGPTFSPYLNLPPENEKK